MNLAAGPSRPVPRAWAEGAIADGRRREKGRAPLPASPRETLATTAPSTRASARTVGTTRHTREPGATSSRCSPRSRTLRAVACRTRARSR